VHREVFTPKLHKELLRETFSDSPPDVIRNRKTPWETENTEEPGDTLRQELREKRSTLLEKAEERWQKKYDGSVKGNRFREIAPDAKYTIKLSKLPLAAFLRNSPRLILSKLVQFRSGHALMGAWFLKHGHPICGTCLRELESISHILCHCVLREDIRYILQDSCASLEEKVLLGTFKGLTAVAKFIAEESKRQSQASHSGA
jgi:hypothetical protein